MKRRLSKSVRKAKKNFRKQSKKHTLQIDRE